MRQIDKQIMPIILLNDIARHSLWPLMVPYTRTIWLSNFTLRFSTLWTVLNQIPFHGSRQTNRLLKRNPKLDCKNGHVNISQYLISLYVHVHKLKVHLEAWFWIVICRLALALKHARIKQNALLNRTCKWILTLLKYPWPVL